MVNLMQVPADRAFRIPQRPGNLADGPAFRQLGGDLALHWRQPQGRGHHSRIDAGRVARLDHQPSHHHRHLCDRVQGPDIMPA